jgi:hypothetical protein
MTHPTYNDAIMDQSRGFHQWSRLEIFTGTVGSIGLYVPNVGDIIFDVPNAVIYKVTNVDYTTGLSTWVEWNLVKDSSNINVEDIFVGGGGGSISESFRLHIDTSVVPYSICLDTRMHMYSSNAVSYRVFLGTDVTESGTIISSYYDQNNVLVSDTIPLENATLPNLNNISVKSGKIGYTNRQLNDGDVVTVVVYNTIGGVIETTKLLAHNTRYIRSNTASNKHVIGISLESPYNSPTDPKVINYPINGTIASNNLMGVVHYNTGEQLRLPIDGVKFKLVGLQNYVSTVSGERTQLLLKYILTAGEQSFNTNINQAGEIVEYYYAVTVPVQDAYAVKLFAYPRWLDEPRGYTLDYYMYSLDRNIARYVTPFVELAVNSAPFVPTLYGTEQNVTVTLNLKDTDPNYNNHFHTQTFNILLHRRGNLPTMPRWTIGFSPSQNPKYGGPVVARASINNGATWLFDLKSGATTREGWINELYYRTEPLRDPRSETAAPIPSHVEVVFKNRVYEIAVEQWDQGHLFINDLSQGETLILRWIKRMGNGVDLLLGTSGMTVLIV